MTKRFLDRLAVHAPVVCFRILFENLACRSWPANCPASLDQIPLRRWPGARRDRYRAAGLDAHAAEPRFLVRSRVLLSVRRTDDGRVWRFVAERGRYR